jgi:hypothetical protein
MKKKASDMSLREVLGHVESKLLELPKSKRNEVVYELYQTFKRLGFNTDEHSIERLVKKNG